MKGTGAFIGAAICGLAIPVGWHWAEVQELAQTMPVEQLISTVIVQFGWIKGAVLGGIVGGNIADEA